MEEKKEKFSIDKENLKKETVETAKKVKESIKVANIKEETKATKGFIIEMFKDPLGKIKEVANDNSVKFLKIVLFLLIVWIITVLISSTYSTIGIYGFSRVFGNILDILKTILAPVIGILVYSIIVVILNKEKKTLTTVISTVTITKIPVIFSALVSLLTIVSSGLLIITIPLTEVCSLLSIILGYFGFKHLFKEDDDKTFIKKYILIQIVYYVVYILIKLLGIYI